MRHLLFSLVGLVICLVLFDVTHIDLSVQQWLFYHHGHWLWDRHEAVAKLVFYDGIKALLITFTVAFASTLVWPRRLLWRGARKGDIAVAVVAMIAIPLIVGVLKATTHVNCPRTLSLFGGEFPYRTLLESLFRSDGMYNQRCFPAGHASGGFALLSLVAVCPSRQGRQRVITWAVMLGWVMGLYKMAIGDHFLSHTIVSMVLAWGIVNALMLTREHWWPTTDYLATPDHHSPLTTPPVVKAPHLSE